MSTLLLSHMFGGCAFTGGPFSFDRGGVAAGHKPSRGDGVGMARALRPEQCRDATGSLAGIDPLGGLPARVVGIPGIS